VRVVISREAEGDLQDLGEYISRDNAIAAVRLLRELREKAMALGHWPERFPLIARYADVGVRRRGHGNYAIFYRVESDRVLVMRIVHGARDDAMLLGGNA
jgi:toxin ParE1/3/4